MKNIIASNYFYSYWPQLICWTRPVELCHSLRLR